MTPNRLLLLATSAVLVTASERAEAQLWGIYDPDDRIFESLSPLTMVVVAVVSIALAGVLIYGLVKLIERFGDKR